MFAFIFVILGVLLFVTLVCLLLGRGIRRDSFDYDSEYLWDQFGRQKLDGARSQDQEDPGRED